MEKYFQNPQTPTAIAPNVAPKRRNRCGAEKKRRRKARLAAASDPSNPITISYGPSIRGGAPNTKKMFPTGGKSSMVPAPEADRQISTTVERIVSGGRELKGGYTNAQKKLRSNESSFPTEMERNTQRSISYVQPFNTTHSGADSQHLRVAVINQLHPLGKLTPEQAGLIESELQAVLDAHIFAPSTIAQLPAPIFEGMNYSDEILKISCCDESSRQWLEQAVVKLGKLWKGCKLALVRADRLPRLVEVIVWIPGPPEDQATVLSRLAAQNPWAEVNQWLVFHDAPQQQPLSRLLVAGVSENIATIINSRRNRLFYKFSSLRVKTKFSKPAEQ